MLDQRLIEADASHPEKLHDIAMDAVLIEHGAVEKLSDCVRALTDGKKILLVTGPTLINDVHEQNIKEAVCAQLKKSFDVEWLVISEPDSIVHCTPENAAKIQARFEGVDCVVGVGSGTICDLNKYATFYADKEHPLPLIIVQTALSVNAFSDNSSVMLISGVKRTVHSRYPSILIIDLDIVTAAPPEMNVSGYGDLIATWTAPVDWYLGHVLGMGSGNFHTAPSDMIRTQCERLLENSSRLAACDPKVIGDLANVLTLSGFSMGLADESSPASGSEHVMSHLIDMSSGVRKTGICYHGTQVAVSGILSGFLTFRLLRRLLPGLPTLKKAAACKDKAEGQGQDRVSYCSFIHSILFFLICILFSGTAVPSFRAAKRGQMPAPKGRTSVPGCLLLLFLRPGPVTG